MNINKKNININRPKLKIVMVLLLLCLALPQMALADWYNPFSWSNTEATWYNPFSWSNVSSTKADGSANLNPFSYLPGCTTNCADSNKAGGTSASTNNNSTAQSLNYRGGGVGGLFDLSQGFLSRLMVLLISLAVVWFVWNVFHYVIAVDEVDKATAKDKIVWGLIAIFIMVSIWGLVAILQYTFQIFPSSSAPQINNVMPTFNFPQ